MTQPIQRDLEVMARLRAALREHDGNVSETARALGVNKGNIHHALHRGTFSATLRRALGLEPWPTWRPRGDLVPRDRLVGVHPFQCPECATLHTEGVIDDERETRYLAGSRQRRYCCDAHGRAWRRRQAATVERGKLSA